MNHPLKYSLFLFFLCLTNSTIPQVKSREIKMEPSKLIDLPIYQPTLQAVEVLDQVLDDDNPNLPDTKCGIFKVSKIQSDLRIGYSSQKICNMIDIYDWQNYFGCVIYRNKLFLLVRDSEFNTDYEDLFAEDNGKICFGAINFLTFQSFDPTWIFTKEEDRFCLMRIEFSDGLIQLPLNLGVFE